MTIDKTVATAADAVADIPDGASLAVGGFGLCGIPIELIEALLDQGASGPLRGVEQLRRGRRGAWASCSRHGRIARMTASYVGENKEFARQYLAGELEVELIPQGTLAEKMRAGGAGIPAFFTPSGVGTQVAEGGMPWRMTLRRLVAKASPPKEVRDFRRPRADFVLEESIVTDFALVRAAARRPARQPGVPRGRPQLQPAAPRWRAGSPSPEVEELVEPGEIDPDAVHLPGSSCTGSCRSARRRQADREAHRPRDAKERADDRRDQRAAGPATRWPPARPRELHRRRVREPRHRPADADPQPHPGRRARGPAVRERHPRHRPLPDRGRGRPGPDQRRQGDGDRPARRGLLRLGLSASA